MDIEKLKAECLKSIEKEKQLADGDKAAGRTAMKSYHTGRMEVWLNVYQTLVHWF